MSQLQMKEPFFMVVTDGIKTRFFHSTHQRNGRFKTITALTDMDSESLKIPEIIEEIQNDTREQVVLIAPPKALNKLTQFFPESLSERVVSQLSRNMVKKTTDEILTYLQRKDKFQLVKKEPLATN